MRTNLKSTFKSQNNFSNLNQNLAEFGLCPFDWTIEVKNNNMALIKNTEEEDFQFIGKLDRTNSHWEHIQLHSI